MEGNPVNKLRVFLALPLNEFTSVLKNQIEILQPLLPDVRWNHPKDLHITLHFFGAIPQDRLSLIYKAAQDAVKNVPGILVALRDFGFFPDQKAPTVIWAGVKDEGDALKRLQKEMNSALEREGFEVEKRPFVPHVTLGRFSKPAKNLIPDLPVFSETPLQKLQEVAVYQSVLSPKGSRYEILEKFFLS